jgi:biopolymer transport protein ExbB/TolQ
MTKKKSNLISIIPAILFIGAAVGIQTKNIITHTVIGLIVGIIVYFFLKNRNKKINN